MVVLQYKPLDPNKDIIRVLTVKPGNSDEPIQCELEQVDLADRPAYITLSYTWDQTGGRASVVCCGVIIEISKNLRNFLHQFRLWKGNRNIRLWVDALCTYCFQCESYLLTLDSRYQPKRYPGAEPTGRQDGYCVFDGHIWHRLAR